MALCIILCGTWKVFRNKENNKKYVPLWHFGPLLQISCGAWAKIIADPCTNIIILLAKYLFNKLSGKKLHPKYLGNRATLSSVYLSVLLHGKICLYVCLFFGWYSISVSFLQLCAFKKKKKTPSCPPLDIKWCVPYAFFPHYQNVSSNELIAWSTTPMMVRRINYDLGRNKENRDYFSTFQLDNHIQG